MTKSWKIAVAACLACLVLAGIRPVALVANQACPSQEPGRGQRQAERGQDEARPEPTFSRLALCGLFGKVEPSSDADGSEGSPELPKWTDEVQAWSAGTVALLTLVLLAINGFQFRLLVRSTRAAERAAETAKSAAVAAVESAQATKVQADTAQASVQLAEDTAVAQLRAYVYTHTVTGHLPGGEGGVFAVSVEVRNYGQTPARNVRAWLAVWPAGHPDPGDFRGAPDDFAVRAVLAPGGAFSLNQEVGPVLPWLAPFRAGTHAVYAYGRIDYTDAFGKERFTNYRLVCPGPRVAAGNGAFDLCREGNNAE